MDIHQFIWGKLDVQFKKDRYDLIYQLLTQFYLVRFRAERGYYDLLDFLILNGAKVCFTDIKKQNVSNDSFENKIKI